MSYLNANTPPLYCKIRREYLYDLKEHIGESEDCVVFGIASIPGRAVLFHALLPNGAVFYRLPITAFFQKRFSRSEVPDMSIHEVELWNSFSYYPSVHTFTFLEGARGKYRLGKKWIPGSYEFTIDWAHPEPNILDVEHSEVPDEHKCAHLLRLDNGNFALQPNNRILWNISNFTVGGNVPDYKVQSSKWNAENSGGIAEDSNRMFYKIFNKDKDYEEN
jgi:hypothetical protein